MRLRSIPSRRSASKCCAGPLSCCSAGKPWAAICPHPRAGLVAERVETEVESFSRMIAQRSRKLLGMIRVTTNDVLADCLLTPWLREFTQRFPVVQVETIITDRRLDIARGEADIALRAGNTKVEGEGLVVRRLATGKWGVYCSKKYAVESGKPQNGADLVNHPIIAGAGDLARFDPAFLKEAKAKGVTVASLMHKLKNAKTQVYVTAGPGVVEQAPRTGRKKGA